MGEQHLEVPSRTIAALLGFPVGKVHQVAHRPALLHCRHICVDECRQFITQSWVAFIKHSNLRWHRCKETKQRRDEWFKAPSSHLSWANNLCLQVCVALCAHSA